MKIRDAVILTLDTETTGLDQDKDRICEVGWSPLYFNHKSGSFDCDRGVSQRINPDMPMPPEAAAVHHLTSKMLSSEPLMEEWESPLVADLFVAHNAPFDRAFCVRQGVVHEETPWLCTMRLAKHVFPDAPSFKNQVLRYWLGFEDVPGDAHSAGHDAEVTAMILCEMLRVLGANGPMEIDTIIALAESPVYLLGKMKFGKHSDLTYEECHQQDRGYLQWMRKQGAESDVNPDGWDRDVWYTINQLLG